MSKRIKTHSNYTIKKVHKKLSNDQIIYERDYAVTYNGGSWDSGSIPFGTQSFKMVQNYKTNNSKKHKYGDWLKQNECTDSNNANGENWTLNCLTNTNSVNEESEIIIKPNYNSLLDFAYYGSCSDLIQASVKDIINKFPGDMRVTDTKISYIDIKDNALKYVNYNGKTLFLISNPFGIDIVKRGLFHVDDSKINKLRYFCESENKYEIRDSEDKFVSCINSWEVEDENKPECVSDGEVIKIITLNKGDDSEIVIYYIYVNGERQLFSEEQNIGLRICLVEEEKSDFFNNLDDFEKIMLNRYTMPIYTMILDYPHETDYGIETYKKAYSWPTIDGWNLDIESNQYAAYIKDLLTLASFYDERQTDNLWRAMTHDSIKNMDLTYTRGNSTDEHEDYVLGTTKLKGLFAAYGRQFDEIKRYIDNIKSINKISYDKNNNLPDYFLTDSLELSGWEPTSVYPNSINGGITSVNNLYTGDNREYSATDANNEFLRRLKINSKAIFSRKGTRYGIDLIMGLFGLKSYDFAKNYYIINGGTEKDWNDLSEIDKEDYYDYKINEFVVVASGLTSGIKVDDVKTYNSYKKSYIDNGEWGETDELQGLPVREVEYTDSNNTPHRYLIPWFSKTDEIDGKPYFQLYGGWGKSFKKNINVKLEIDNSGNTKTFSEIYGDEENRIYDETIKFLNIVKKRSDLDQISESKLTDGDIYYVSNLDNENESHYFIYKKGEWKNIPYSDIEQGYENENGFKILYLESILDEHKGNNPHGGYGKYDDGEEFIDYFRKLFKYSVENDNFKDIAYECNGKLKNEIEEAGFKLSEYVLDNVKTWYFTDTNDTNTKLRKIEEKFGEKKENKDGYSEMGLNYTGNGIQENTKVGKNASEMTFESSLEPYNFEMGEKYDEAAANSIINTKKMIIEFASKLLKEKGFYEYLNNCIMPYVKQMIPSTTIFEVNFGNDAEAEWQCLITATVAGISE